MFKKKIPLRFLTVIVIAGLSAGYFFYQMRGVIFKPYLVVDSPLDGEILENGFVVIKGKAGRANALSLNGRKVFVDARGRFSHGLLLASGYNIIELTAKDNFGREIKKTKAVMVK